jgi:hypothetical protein
MMVETAIILVADDSADLTMIRKEAEARGLTNVTPLPALGILRGVTDRRRLDELRAIAGVVSVEAERTIQLPPPNSRVQ